MVLAAICFGLLLSSSGYANEVKSVSGIGSGNCSVNVRLKTSLADNSNVTLNMYRVCYSDKLDKDGAYVLAEKFNKFPITPLKDPENDVMDFATTLDGYISYKSIEPDYTVKTNKDGVASFSNVSDGIYLVEGETYYHEDKMVIPSSAIIFLTENKLKREQTKTRNVDINVKYEIRNSTKNTKIEAIKVWNDNDSASRPGSVTLELYCDKVLVQTVTLNKENNWKHSWTNLAQNGKWTLAEKDVPSGYTVSVARRDDCFVVTNTLSNISLNKQWDTLPQTGLLWWPVPILSVTGVLFTIIGIILNSK